MQYVIIGNSAAAIGAVEGIRKVDREGKIRIITSERNFVYGRPLISYLLAGKTTEEKMKYRPDDFYLKNNCEILYSTNVDKIDAAEKKVFTDSGDEFSYDKLLVSTGSAPFVPPMHGIERVTKKFSFMTLDDALSLKEVLTKETKVIIIGAGLIGLKCAEGISHLVKSIDVVDLAPRILSSILEEDTSRIIQAHLEKENIRFHLGTSVSEFTENEALLQNGERISFDICVLAVGVKANTALIKDAGGEVNRGIVVDTHMKTSLADIYAAGDCAEGYDSSVNANRVLALLPNAYMQGECAGKNMAGEPAEYRTAIPMNAIGFFGLHIATAGIYEGNVFKKQDADTPYKKLFYDNNRLNGYIIIGNIEKVGIYTSLIREKTPLDTIDFDLICETPGLMAFSREARSEKLG